MAVHQQLEQKWLGNIRIPFSTVYLNGKACLSFWHYGQHQKPFLHHLPQWKGLSVFLALWATSKTLSPPSTSMERPVCLFGTMGNIKNPFSTIYLSGKACLSFWHYGNIKNPFSTIYLCGKVCLSVFLAL